jgi:hypothetical protein
MPKRSSKRPNEDVNQAAFRVVRELTGDADSESAQARPRKKNAAAVALGRRGGKKGGKARAAALSPEQRREIAAKAARARWSKADAESAE